MGKKGPIRGVPIIVESPITKGGSDNAGGLKHTKTVFQTPYKFYETLFLAPLAFLPTRGAPLFLPPGSIAL